MGYLFRFSVLKFNQHFKKRNKQALYFMAIEDNIKKFHQIRTTTS